MYDENLMTLPEGPREIHLTMSETLFDVFCNSDTTYQINIQKTTKNVIF